MEPSHKPSRSAIDVSLGGGAPSRGTSPLLQQRLHSLAAADQLLFELGDLVAAPADQVQLAGGVGEGLFEDLAAADRVLYSALPLAAQLGPGALGLDQLLQLLER